ncbi:MAG TPA: GntR family transcriptional regulator [Alphaproteobacteria bacterium]|nr:GntR family transcriptional regulator [Alphaproteobacteria bacterium]
MDSSEQLPRARPVRRQSLHEQAIDQLRNMIVEGELGPGARLVEAEICRHLDISRTPLREALKVLASEGLVELLPNRGARVTRVSVEHVDELFEAIAGIEGMAAGLACRRMSVDDLERLKEMHELIVRLHGEHKRHEYFQLNHQIHEIVVRLAGNRILAEMHSKLLARARRIRYMAILSTARWDEALGEHIEFMNALSTRNAERAGEIWRRHVARTGEVVRAALSAETERPRIGPLYA